MDETPRAHRDLDDDPLPEPGPTTDENAPSDEPDEGQAGQPEVGGG